MAATIASTSAAVDVRITWSDLPDHVRVAVEAILGGPVVSAAFQAGGFSPGTADRVVTAADHRAFVKAVSRAQNQRSPEIHRSEAAIAARLPATQHAPRLLGSYDDGEWVALVLEDVDGRHPVTPWDPTELHTVLTSLNALTAALTPAPIVDVPSAEQALTSDFAGWARLAADLPGGLDPWAAARLDELAGCAELGLRSLQQGDSLVHADLRADNLLLRGDGTVAFVDWPWACIGLAWLDVLLLLVGPGLARRILPRRRREAGRGGTSDTAGLPTTPGRQHPGVAQGTDVIACVS